MVLAAFLVVAGFAPGTVDTQEPVNPASEARKRQLAFYGGGASHAAARYLGVSEIMGKPVGTPPPSPKPLSAQAVNESTLAIAKRDEPRRGSANVPIRDFPNVSENEPTVAANPREPSRLVAGTHFIGDTGNRCIAHYSRNGGRTWNLRPIFMPQLTHQSQCSDPVLAYAPDGSRVYYAYMDIKESHFDIVVSYSDDDGATWKGPIVALSNPVADYDKPWIGTHVPVVGDSDDGRKDDNRRQRNTGWVYISATRFDFSGPCHIDFARSANMGTTWSSPQTLDTSGGFCGQPVVVQGSRPNGGVGGDVLVAWYHSGVDGWLNGSFQVRTRFSSNNGAAFGPITIAATDSFELPFWLGPSAFYHRWWLAMFPDVEIAPDGSAHILYTHDPEPGSETAEDGDIRYLGSARPYTAWSAPTTVNDDGSGKAQGLATLEANVHRGRTLYAIWEDHRESPNDNFKYDVFWSKKVGIGPWDHNERLTTAQSTSDFFFVGDYYDLTVARGGGDEDGRGDSNGLFVYGVWTDRRDEPTPFDLDDDVWGARIPPASREDDN
jgi:hypothetical protein